MTIDKLDPKGLEAAARDLISRGIGGLAEAGFAIKAYLAASTAGVPGEQTEALKLTPAMISAARKASSIYDLSEKWQRHERVMRTGDFSFEFTQMWNAALSASLSSPPVSQQAEAVGWLYNNEDTGREFSEQHPVESGEVPDATNVEPATASNLLAELRLAWSSPAPDAVEPSVKALEWTESRSGAWAKSLLGNYYASALQQLMPKRIVFRWKLGIDGNWSGEDFDTLELAKAAAQADYDARIRSALAHTSPVSAPGVVEALLKCAEILAGLEAEDGGRTFPTKQDCRFARMAINRLRSPVVVEGK